MYWIGITCVVIYFIIAILVMIGFSAYYMRKNEIGYWSFTEIVIFSLFWIVSVPWFLICGILIGFENFIITSAEKINRYIDTRKENK